MKDSDTNGKPFTMTVMTETPTPERLAELLALNWKPSVECAAGPPWRQPPWRLGEVTIYGAPTGPEIAPVDPYPVFPPLITPTSPWVTLPQGQVSPHVARGLVALLPLLKAATKLRSATPDEAVAMCWFEGLAAGLEAAGAK